ncbi:MAG: hypothetical protein ACLVAT_04730 [Lachnospiraceae bacterium]
MTLKDYQRNYLFELVLLGIVNIFNFLLENMDLAQADEEQEEREHEIYLEYPEYYEDREFWKKKKNGWKNF